MKSTLKIVLAPCNKVNYYGLEVDENCNSNEKQQDTYLDPAKAFFVFSIIYNNEEFVADKFGDESILRESNYYGT